MRGSSTQLPAGEHEPRGWGGATGHYCGDDRDRTRASTRVSSTGGSTWAALHVIADPVDSVNYPSQVDVTDTVDPATGYVYASFLIYGVGGTSKTNVAVARSTDHGATWTAQKI